ncbi:hypothetical protein NDU88_005347 [Pleurodeles waltl]|uniref:Uncharacterized protein n=1 Tax=Pleurodeles waltl TaxID=8319 RepID=A0AAV7WYI1_PLEWA|nr:hypothetical protein NDU88_005347 [Pleurodeles waltl]
MSTLEAPPQPLVPLQEADHRRSQLLDAKFWLTGALLAPLHPLVALLIMLHLALRLKARAQGGNKHTGGADSPFLQ